MRKFYSIILLIFALSCFKANAWVYTTLEPDSNGWNYYYSEPIKMDSEEGKVVFKICIAQKRSTGELQYFFLYLPPEPKYVVWDTPEKAPKNFKKGFVMKIRDGVGNVIDLTLSYNYDWKIEKITQKAGETLKGSPIFETTYKIDQLKVWYKASKENFYSIVDNGFKKIRVETTSPDRYEDFNFTEKQTKSTSKDLKKHLKNMLKRVDEIEKKLVKSRAKLSESNAEPTKQKTVEEF